MKKLKPSDGVKYVLTITKLSKKKIKKRLSFLFKFLLIEILIRTKNQKSPEKMKIGIHEKKEKKNLKKKENETKLETKSDRQNVKNHEMRSQKNLVQSRRIVIEIVTEKGKKVLVVMNGTRQENVIVARIANVKRKKNVIKIEIVRI